jgi:hypothetical protein
MHYHGTPITPRAKLLELAGRSFCVPWPSPGDLEVCHEIGESVMLDNGAFTIWRKQREGKPIPARLIPASQGDWSSYYAWAEPWLDYHTTWAIIPDVIDGDAEANDALISEWPFGDRGVPVWHMHEPVDRLLALAGEWPRVAIGSSGAYADVGTVRWHVRMTDAMDQLCGDGPTPTWLHMLRGLNLADGPYPFASADSTDIARNHAGNHVGARLPKSPRLMAERIGGRNTPGRWRVSPAQGEMWAS